MAVFYTRATALSNHCGTFAPCYAFNPMLLEDIKRAAERLTGMARPSPRQALVRVRKENTYLFADDGLTPNHPQG